MITRSILISFFLISPIVFLYGQETPVSVVSIKAFTDNPWLFVPTPQSIQTNYPFLKDERYAVKNRLNPARKDTIIHFFKGETSVFFYKPYNGATMLVSANIADERIVLKGQVSIGLTSNEFYSRIGYPSSKSEILKISLPDGLYNTRVFFKKGKVVLIKIEVRNPNK